MFKYSIDCVIVASAALQILMNTGSTLKEKFPDTCEHLLQTLQSMVKIGTSRQAKHAVRCLANMFDNKEELFDQIATVSYRQTELCMCTWKCGP
jgi:sister-chromatid-cohesion protein PDS5